MKETTHNLLQTLHKRNNFNTPHEKGNELGWLGPSQPTRYPSTRSRT